MITGIRFPIVIIRGYCFVFYVLLSGTEVLPATHGDGSGGNFVFSSPRVAYLRLMCHCEDLIDFVLFPKTTAPTLDIEEQVDIIEQHRGTPPIILRCNKGLLR